MPEYLFAERGGKIVSVEYDGSTSMTPEQVKASLKHAFSLFPYPVTIKQVENLEDIFQVSYPHGNNMGDILICAKGTTPGGRIGLSDEQRIQPKAKYLNYVNAKKESGTKGVFLGVYKRDGQTILCTWNVTPSEATSEETPISKQIKISSIAGAIREGFVLQDKGRGTFACAFKPEFLYFYLRNSDWLHTGQVSNLSKHYDENEFTDIKVVAVGQASEVNRKNDGENVLLYGVPGAGKSWTIQEEYCKDETRIERLVFHPDYMYSDFVGQILPDVKKNEGAEEGTSEEKVRYEFTAGPFTKILRKAFLDPEQSYFLIIEEINRGNAPAIFGEIFQLLDRKTEMLIENDDGFPIGTSEYGITNANIASYVYGDAETKVRIPSNLSIIGTMNTSDQNVFTLDTAFQRRWIMRLIPNSFNGHKFAKQLILDSDVSWMAFCKAINDEILRRSNLTYAEDKRLGAYFIAKSDLELQSIPKTGDKREIARVERYNSRFAEKVLKYLWDDAFKFSHAETFNTREYNSLELVIEGFNSTTGNDRFKIFHENLRKAILETNTEDVNLEIETNAELGTIDSQ